MNRETIWRVCIVSTILFLVPQLCIGQSQTAALAQPINQQNSTATASTAVPTIPTYSDSPKGLEKLIRDMLKLDKGRDDKKLAPFVQSLALPSPDTWFRATFGDAAGAELAASYDRTRLELPMSFPDILAQLRAKHFDEPKAVRFDDSCDPNATSSEYDVLTWRTNSQPLYDVRFVNQTSSASVRFFAYVEGSFRYVGNFQATTSKPAPHPVYPKKLAVGGNVMMARLTHQVTPAYPVEARLGGISGTVVLHAIIGTNGKVCQLQVISGPPILAPSALFAVRQWRYNPTMLMGEPVAVETTIQVIFNIQ
ncbi:MAG TPA: energy transducer TonB [Candidatus Acidoferrales bacterium]|nr:energy transducer TonB [Candidatus Acidoferrales bacterium]